MASELTDVQRATLRLVCDTVVPSLENEPDAHGLWARQASDIASASRTLAVDDETCTNRHGREWCGAGAAQASVTRWRTASASTCRLANERTERLAAMALDTGPDSIRTADPPISKPHLPQQAMRRGLSRSRDQPA